MDRKIAEQIVALVNTHIDQLISSLEPVETQIPPEEFAAYKRGVARVINTYDLEIIERIAREFPDLRPADEDSEPPAEESVPPRPSRSKRAASWCAPGASLTGAEARWCVPSAL